MLFIQNKCLSPDGRVRICGVPHGRDPPSMNSLVGAYFRGPYSSVGFETLIDLIH